MDTIKKLAIFDFDGVIVDSFAACYEIAQMNEPEITEAQYRARFEGNINETMKEAHKDMVKVVTDYEAEYGPRILAIPPLPDVERCIRELSKKACDLVIVSSSPVCSIGNYLGKYGLAEYFTEVVGNEVHPSKVVKIRMILENYGVDPSNALFVTDTLGDVQEALRVGVRTLAVGWGYNSPDTLSSGNPDLIIREPDELLGTIEAELGS